MIGLFDSGVGGLSVLRAIIQSGINDDFVYFGDTKNVPYGTKTKEEILSYTREIMRFFMENGVESAIMACNTSSALVYDELCAEFSDRIKIYPLIQSVAPFFTDEKETIGVMATKATVKSFAYTKEIMKQNKNAKVIELECQDFVRIVENRLYDDAGAIRYIKEKAEQLKNAGCKKVILGCTHFPYLAPILSKFAAGVEFIDPAKYLVEVVKKGLAKNGYFGVDAGAAGSAKTFSTFKFYVSKDPEGFKRSGSIFFDIKDEVRLMELQKPTLQASP